MSPLLPALPAAESSVVVQPGGPLLLSGRELHGRAPSTTVSSYLSTDPLVATIGAAHFANSGVTNSGGRPFILIRFMVRRVHDWNTENRVSGSAL